MVVEIKHDEHATLRVPVVLVLVSSTPVKWQVRLPYNHFNLAEVMVLDGTTSGGSVTIMDKSFYKVDNMVTRPSGIKWSGFGNDENSGSSTNQKTPFLLTYIERRYGKIRSFSGIHQAESWELYIEGKFPSIHSLDYHSSNAPFSDYFMSSEENIYRVPCLNQGCPSYPASNCVEGYCEVKDPDNYDPYTSLRKCDSYLQEKNAFTMTKHCSSSWRLQD